MKLPTASKLALADECAPSWVLPQMRETHETAVEGNDLHGVLRVALRLMREASTPVERYNLESMRSSAWLDGVLEVIGDRLNGAKAEAAYAYDVTTGTARMLGYDLGRSYGQTDTEFAGAADYVVEGEDVVDLYDLKTGLTPQEPIEHHAQMKGLACAAGTFHNKPVRTWLIIAPRDGQKPRIVAGPTYGAFDLLELGEWLRGIAERLQRAHGSPDRNKRFSVGKWCTTCPARRSCPARQGLFMEALTQPEKVKRDMAEMLADPATRTLGYHVRNAYRGLMKELDEQLFANIREHGPIDAGKGKVFGPHETPELVIEPTKAWTYLEERFGTAAAKAAMTYETSKTAVMRVVSEHSPRGRKGALAEAAIAELKAIPGAIVEKVKTTTEEHSPRTQSAIPALPAAPIEPPAVGAPVLVQPGDAAQENA